MALTAEGFLRRLATGKAVNGLYRTGGRAGLISAWRLGGRFILTWEECPAGRQYDESTYTRDDRYEFETAGAVLAFVEQAGFPASEFSP